MTNQDQPVVAPADLDQNPSATSDQQAKAPTPKKKKQPPEIKARSLTDYYADKQLNAKRFLAALNKNKVGKLTEDDQKQASAELDALDQKFLRTLNLLFHSQSLRDPAAVSCKQFAINAAQRQAEKHYGVVIEIELSPTQILETILTAMKPALMAKKTDARALNLTKALALWLTDSRSLEILELIEALSSTLVKDYSKKPDVAAIRKGQMAILLNPKVTLTNMQVYAAFAGIGAAVARSAKQVADQEQQRVKQAQQRIEALTLDLDQTKRALNDATLQLDQLREEIEGHHHHRQQQEENLKTHQQVSAHVHGEIRGHSYAFLNRTVRPLLQDAQDFAELNPPGMDVVRERLEQTFKAIEDELKWLKSSD